MLASLSIDDADAFKILCVLGGAIGHLYWTSLRHRDRLDKTKERVSHLENSIASCPADNCPLQRSPSATGNQAQLSFSLRADVIPCVHRHTCKQAKS